MARPKKSPLHASVVGTFAGQAIGEGLAEGLAEGMRKVREELEAFQQDLLASLRQHAEAELKMQAEEEAAAPVLELVRTCEESGCRERAVARGRCRRHYARMVYQERKAREGGTVRPRRLKVADKPGGDTVEKKNVAPVAPIRRRKPGEEEVAAAAMASGARAPEAPATKAPPTPEDIARFLGIGK